MTERGESEDEAAGAKVRLGLSALLAAQVGAVLTGAFLLFADHSLFRDHPKLAGVVERVQQGELFHTYDYVAAFGLLATAVNTVIVAGLLLTLRWWLSSGPVVENRDLAPPGRRWCGGFLALTLGAAIAGAYLGYQRLPQSLWDDEVSTVHTAVHGSYDLDESGQLAFRPASWWNTAWYQRTLNNQITFSVLSRISLLGWQKLTGAAEDEMSEAVVRLPAYLAGIASIVAIALLLRRIGFSEAGILAAWLLALHPWHLRYLSEARGYSLMLLLVSVSLITAVGALHRGSWLRWAGYGLAQLLLLWTNPGAVAFVGILNLAVAASIWRASPTRPVARRGLARFAVANLASGAVWIQLMAPNVPQVVKYLDSQPFAPVAASFLDGFTAHLLFGMPFGRQPLDPRYPELLGVAQDSPGLVWAVFGLGIALAAVGAIRLLAARGPRAALAAVFLLPGPLTYLLIWLRDGYLFERYLLFFLPGFVAFLSLGVVSLPRWIANTPLRRALTVGAAAVYLAGYAVVTHPARSVLLTRPLQPIRESVAVTRGTLHPLDPANQQILTVSAFGRPRSYDPRVVEVETAEEMRAFVELAREQNKPLFVNIGPVANAKRKGAGPMAVVLDDALFEEVAVLPAFTRAKTRHVYRYRGGAGGGESSP